MNSNCLIVVQLLFSLHIQKDRNGSSVSVFFKQLIEGYHYFVQGLPFVSAFTRRNTLTRKKDHAMK